MKQALSCTATMLLIILTLGLAGCAGGAGTSDTTAQPANNSTAGGITGSAK